MARRIVAAYAASTGLGSWFGALAIYLFVSLLSTNTLITNAFAENSTSKGAAPAGAQQSIVTVKNQMPFDIAPQDLNAAILEFANKAGIQVFYDTVRVKGLRTKGVHGTFAIDQALDLLLAGTGLSYAFTDGHTVKLEALPPGSAKNTVVLPTLKVQAEQLLGQNTWGPVKGYVAKNTATATRTDTPIIEIPASIDVITRDQMNQQNVQRSVKEALRYTSDVVAEVDGETADGYDMDIYSRGFALDEYLDGLKLLQGEWGALQIDPYLLERVEVLKGPASVLYGQVNPGGILNMVSKRPLEAPVHEIQFQAGSYSLLQGAFDWGGPIDRDGHFLYRIAGVARDTHTQVHFSDEQRYAISPGFTWRPDANTNLTLLATYQYDPHAGIFTFVPAQGTFLHNPNGSIPTSFNMGDPNFQDLNRTQYLLTYLFEHRFNQILLIRQNFRYDHVDVHQKQLWPLALEPNLKTLDRYAYSDSEDNDAITLDSQAEAKFLTGPLHHIVLVGVDWQRYMWDQRTGFGDAPPINIFGPVYEQQIASPPIGYSISETLDQVGIYGQDQISLGRLSLLLSGRQDWADSSTYDRLARTTTKQSDNAFTGRAGILYLFGFGLSPYFSYSESFEPTVGTDFGGSPFKPTTGQQEEFGLKYQPAEVDALLTVALFHLTEQNVLTTDPAHPNFQVQTGEIRSQGIELEGKASLTENFNIIAGYSYLDARIIKSTTDNLNKQPLAIPTNMASVWGDYTLHGGDLAGLGAGLGVRYVGATYGDDPNQLKVPAYTLVDGEVHYDLAGINRSLTGARLAINGTNLFDHKYIASCFNGPLFCSYGLRQKITGTISYRW